MSAYITIGNKTPAINPPRSLTNTEGVTTMILNNCNLSGEVKKDVLLIESDERYLRHTLKLE